jgi:cholesterol oxidase
MTVTESVPDNNATSSNTTKRRTRSLSKGFVDLVIELTNLPETVFDVVIVGSGYGGSVAAQQLAGLQKLDKNGKPLKISVCVLERGGEYLPGMFPAKFADLPGHVRYGAQGTGQVTGMLEGLFDVRTGADVQALVANGLGGGSLINAGVMAKPKFSEFESHLPQTVIDALAGDSDSNYLERAKTLLLGQPLAVPNTNTIENNARFTNQSPLKFQRLKKLGETVGEHAAADITVAMRDQAANPYSVNLNQCVGCGDCMTGCNVGAKASLDTNLLAQASRDGAKFYTGASVLSIARNDKPCRKDPCQADHLWTLEVVHTLPGLRARAEKPILLKAHKVILAAGTFGSTEILLRSRSEKLGFSNMLGERFSCNGDNIAAVHGLLEPAHCTAGEDEALDTRKVGPTITNNVEVPRKGKELGFLIQEFAVPGPLRQLFAELVTTANVLDQLPTADRDNHGSEHKDTSGGIDPCAVNHAAIERTLVVGLIGHDEANGSLRLPLQTVSNADGSPRAAGAGEGSAQEGALQIVWPQARDGKQINAAHRRLTEYCRSAFRGSNVLANPMWRLLPGQLEDQVSLPRGPVMTVHPLGGCPIGEDIRKGVVDEYGRVFNQLNIGNHNWEGSLIVLDGSIIPGSLGANPALTISAIALRAVEHLRNAWHFAPDHKAPSKDAVKDRPIFVQVSVKPQKNTIVAITERLSGEVALQAGKSPQKNYVVEITLSYDEVALQKLMATWGGRTLQVNENVSYIRIFKAEEWDAGSLLRVANDDVREEWAVYKASLSGTLKFFHREPTSPLGRMTSVWVYLRNRGFREVLKKCFYQEKENTVTPIEPSKSRSIIRTLRDKIRTLGGKIWSLGSTICGALRLATRAGEVRRFDYCLTLGATPKKNTGTLHSSIVKTLNGAVMRGEKRLTYNRRANPWRQMMELTLTQFPSMASGAAPVLTLDTRFVAAKNIPLIQVVDQQSQANTLLDMASFGLFMTRVMLNIHIWSFKKPDHPRVAYEPKRLPAIITGLPMEVIDLTVAINVKGVNAVVRLTRYPRHGSVLNPLAMIHGYSANGTTFTHPSLNCSAAEYFWRAGRDVWVIDLRSSSGMPTATVPWSYEEIALVDIPAALLHIKNATGKRVDVIAHCIGAAMLSMAILTKAQDVRSSAVQLGKDTWISDVQLGALAAFNADGALHTQHPTINAIVLSQKGPLMRYTEGNILRAYFMRSLRRWIAPNGYQFRPPSTPTVADQLVDRLLATMPYPDQDYDAENPWRPCVPTGWTASRHRMDALYAQAFSAHNLKQETLDAIDDLFGPLNMDTVSQTIHFVRFNSITNQAGRGEFVTLARLKERWAGIPTFAIHGADNGLVDLSTQQLLETNFQAAGLPFAMHPFKNFGHQDVFIGKNSKTKVFKELEKFLKSPAKFCAEASATSVPVTQPCDWRFDAPWIGPRLSVSTPKSGQSQHRIYALSSPKYGASQLVLVPVEKIDSGYMRTGDLVCLKPGNSQDWLFVPAPMPKSCVENQGWLAVIAYRYEETTLNTSDTRNLNATSTALAPPGVIGGGSDTTLVHNVVFSNSIGSNFAVDHPLDIKGIPTKRPPIKFEISEPASQLEKEIDYWLNIPANDADLAFVSCLDIFSWTAGPGEDFSFALGSCQYPVGLIDKPVAERSLRTLAEASKSLDFVIFAGDQIYADATAGLLDPVRSDERYDLPYEAALRAEPMRAIMRKVPVHMMLDDHEMVDNWELPHPDNIDATKRANRIREQGLKAYWKYQRLKSYPGQVGREVSYSFDHGCASVYMLDTRSQRRHRKVGSPETAQIFSVEAMKELKLWLLKDIKRLKFIVSPSILLPQRLGMLNDGIDQTTRSDSWDGYPAQMRELFEFIVDYEIDNTVFLSGDEHLCCVASATLTKLGRAPRTIASVHASGLYAPFPFANSKKEDFVDWPYCFDLPKDLPVVHCSTSASFAPPEARFAKISVQCTGQNNPQVEVEFCDKNGKVCGNASLFSKDPSVRRPPQLVLNSIPNDTAR